MLMMVRPFLVITRVIKHNFLAVVHFFMVPRPPSNIVIFLRQLKVFQLLTINQLRLALMIRVPVVATICIHCTYITTTTGVPATSTHLHVMAHVHTRGWWSMLWHVSWHVIMATSSIRGWGWMLQQLISNNTTHLYYKYLLRRISTI